MASNSKNIAELLNTDTTIAVTDVADGSITEAKLANQAVSVDKLHNTLNLTSKTVTLPVGVGGLNWTNSIKTADFTAVEGNGYYVDTSSNAVTVTLPASPSTGHQISVIDHGKNSATNNITLDAGSNKIIGVQSIPTTVSENGISITLVYSGSTRGWVQVSTSDETSTKAQTATISVNYLIVAGGGGGGSSQTGSGGGAGGGAGGMLTGTTTVNALTSHTVLVGLGGAGGAAGGSAKGTDGQGSSFASVTTVGGGGGGDNGGNGRAGGSGGGRGYNNYNASSGYGAGTAGQGNRGGAVVGSSAAGAGGGGKGGVGLSNTGSGGGSGGLGGAGEASSITGSAVTYAAGGRGGGGPSPAAKTDGTGDGGDGAYSTGTPTAGADGIVVVSYIASSPAFTGGTVTNYTSGSDTYQVHSFTSSGTLGAA